MTPRPHYILAKYIPELLRNEPRNVGVVVWTPWGVAAKFRGEKSRGLDQRKIPQWVQSRPAYTEWIHIWRAIIQQGKIKSRHGEWQAEGLDFLDGLATTGKQNYIFGDKGSVMDDIAESDVAPLVNFLFSTLVEDGVDHKSAKAEYDMERICNKIISRTEAFRNRRFKRDLPVFCPIPPNAVETVNFDYAIGDETPEWLYKRVSLAPRAAENSIHAAAWEFRSVIAANIVTREKSAALILPTPEQKKDGEYLRQLDGLRTQARIIDLSDESSRFEDELNKQVPATAPQFRHN